MTAFDIETKVHTDQLEIIRLEDGQFYFIRYTSHRDTNHQTTIASFSPAQINAVLRTINKLKQQSNPN